MYLIGLMTVTLMAGNYEVSFDAPVPPEIWAIGEDPEQGIFDAVIIQDYTVFHQIAIKRFRKIRIFSESGKNAAQLTAPGKLANFKGRVVDRSGKETRFNRKEDLLRVLDMRTRQKSEKTSILLPPGLTSDCIVEMSWDSQTFEGLPPGEQIQSHPVQEAFYVAEKTFKVNWHAIKPSSENGLRTRVVWSTQMKAPARLKHNQTKSYDLVSYFKVPPRLDYPFGNTYFDATAPFVTVFKTYSLFGSKPEQFWKRYGTEALRDYVYHEEFGRPAVYKKWVKDLKKNMPEDHVQALIMVFNQFRERISRTDMLLPSSREVYMQKGPIDQDQPAMLEKVFRFGYGEPWQLAMAFYQLIKDLGLDVQIVLTSNVHGMPFNPSALSPFMLDIYSPLYGHQLENGNWFLVAPTYPQYQAGWVPPHMQGGTGIAYRPKKKWAFEYIRIPRQSASAHQLIRKYDMAIDEHGSMRFTVNEEGSGVYNARAKKTLASLPADEWSGQTLERWQRRVNSWQLHDAKVSGVLPLEDTIKLQVSGKRTRVLEDADWISLFPFPGDTLPLASPTFWPRNRTQPVILPHCLTQVDLCVLKVPEGWKLKGNPSWEKINGVGKVAYKVIQKENTITIRRDITIQRDAFSPNEEEGVKHFITWMEEAGYQTIALSRGDAS